MGILNDCLKIIHSWEGLSFINKKMIKVVESRSNNQEFGVTRHSGDISKERNSYFFSISSTNHRIAQGS